MKELVRLFRMLIMRFKPDLADLVMPMVRGEEIMRIYPQHYSPPAVTVDELRECVREAYGFDFVDEILKGEFYPGLSLEEHSKDAMHKFSDHFGDDSWVASDLEASRFAANKAKHAYC